MKIRQNTLMYYYLEKLDYDYQETTIDLPDELDEIIKDGLIVSNDCIILKSLSDNSPKFETDLEKCEWEYNETHFHPDEYARAGSDEIVYLSYALECAKRIAYKLKNKFPQFSFRITVSFSETVKNKLGQIETYGSSSVQFHKIRENCESTMRTSDLDGFEFDAVLEIEI